MTYAALAALFVFATAVIAVLVTWRRRLGPAWWATTALTILGLLLLTVVFDSLMIAADLFRYDEAQLHGWSVGLAPIEDLAWPIAAGLLLPSLWELFARPAGDSERERSSR